MPTEKVDPLMQRAATASQQAYAPYSHFHVGAAVRCADGSIFTGSNVENASYGLTVCAERIAIFKAVSEGHRDLTALAVTAASDTIPYPCGACRQVMAEFMPAHAPIQIASHATRHAPLRLTLGDLLPHAFEHSTEPNPDDHKHVSKGAALDIKEKDHLPPSHHPHD